MKYRFFRRLMRIVSRTVLRHRLEVTGRERFPRRGPVIVIGNHISTIDPPLVGAYIPRFDVHYMTKAESFGNPRTAWMFRWYNAFPVVRHTADRSALRHALNLLAAGHVVVIYPEGTRQRDATMARPYAGAGFIARKSGAPIVAAAIHGSEAVLRKGATLPHPADVHVVYSEPFTLPERNPDGSPMSHQQSADLMMSRLAALLPESYRGVFAPGRRPEEAAPPAA